MVGKCVGCEECTAEPLAAGTVILGQVKGDCRILVCDGMGQPTTVADDTDLPDDGDPCTLDECANGVPMHQPKCAASQTCNQGVCSP